MDRIVFNESIDEEICEDVEGEFVRKDEQDTRLNTKTGDNKHRFR